MGRVITENINLFHHLKSTEYRIANGYVVAEEVKHGLTRAHPKVHYRKHKRTVPNLGALSADKNGIGALVKRYDMSAHTISHIIHEDGR